VRQGRYAAGSEAERAEINTVLTMKGKYGLKAMIHLARRPAEELAPSAEIAEAETISKKFLDAILFDLRQAGLVQSRKGPSGGYRLARPASEIMVGTVVRALDGPLAPIACASRTAFEACTDCGDIRLCPVRQIMVRVRDAIAGVLDSTSLAQLAAPEAADSDLDRFTDALDVRPKASPRPSR
jgi:Rrf2 family protein